MTKPTNSTPAQAGVFLARIAAVGFGLWYGFHGDWGGVGLMIFLAWLVGLFAAPDGKT